MVNRFEPRAGLDEMIAQRIARPRMHRILDMLHDEVASRAPDAKTWVTMRDERVRVSHFKADTQTIPENLRFILERADSTRDLARAPRDPSLPTDQRAGCRCDAPTLPGIIRESVHRSDVDVNGTLVSGSVESRFPRIIESETGTSEDEGTHFMHQAVTEVAARLRAAES